MRRNLRATLLLGMSLVSLTRDMPAFGQQTGLLPPDAIVGGRTLEEWTALEAEWKLATLFGDPSGLSDMVSGVRFLPPAIGAGEFEIDATLPAGTAFVHTSFGLYGERYSNGSEDDPADPMVAQFFQDAAIETLLDGTVVLGGTAADHPDRLIGPGFFAEPILYNEPQPRGPVDAVASTFYLSVTGLYLLPSGQHTLESSFESSFFGAARVIYHLSVLGEGDYNASGMVEQADLDLVLLNWGTELLDPTSAGWTNDLPAGAIDQAELDKVLLNWGQSSSTIGAASVPEPATWMIAIGLLAVSFALRHSLDYKGLLR